MITTEKPELALEEARDAQMFLASAGGRKFVSEIQKNMDEDLGVFKRMARMRTINDLDEATGSYNAYEDALKTLDEIAKQV